MTTLALYRTIRKRGGSFRVDKQTIAIRPANAADGLGDEIRKHKAELLSILSGTIGIPGELRRFDAGAAYREHQANPPAQDDFAAEVPPALLERPGMTLADNGVWMTRDGFKVSTEATMPAIAQSLKVPA